MHMWQEFMTVLVSSVSRGTGRDDKYHSYLSEAKIAKFKHGLVGSGTPVSGVWLR